LAARVDPSGPQHSADAVLALPMEAGLAAGYDRLERLLTV
jgi:hypothetical protein